MIEHTAWCNGQTCQFCVIVSRTSCSSAAPLPLLWVAYPEQHPACHATWGLVDLLR
jgi:hypothetical protein